MNFSQRVFPLLVLLPMAIHGQKLPPSAIESAPIPMPSDRATDSYLIYSSLLPLGEAASADWPHDMWLVRGVTVSAVSSSEPCQPEPSAEQQRTAFMNPHVVVHPPASRMQDFNEILADFDAHCHDHISLSATAWQTKVPVHLLTPAEQKEFESTRWEKADEAVKAKYQGASGLYSFGEVYFNERHTVALVYATHWCGYLCGEGFWFAFAFENGRWSLQQWATDHWIS